MKKLQDAIASVKTERLGQGARDHLTDLLDGIDFEDELPEIMEIIAQEVVSYQAGVEADPSEIKKFARQLMVSFEAAIDYEINNPKNRSRA